ncbi:MAG: hypothetical protein IJ055_03890 [Oscillospiraceae bacterium]|nr:hypothetical protein [Oscillospiraceae bacterium]
MYYVMKHQENCPKVRALITAIDYHEDNKTYQVSFLGSQEGGFNFSEPGTDFFSHDELEAFRIR